VTTTIVARLRLHSALRSLAELAIAEYGVHDSVHNRHSLDLGSPVPVNTASQSSVFGLYAALLSLADLKVAVDGVERTVDDVDGLLVGTGTRLGLVGTTQRAVLGLHSALHAGVVTD
jgi:hypothetical protein